MPASTDSRGIPRTRKRLHKEHKTTKPFGPFLPSLANLGGKNALVLKRRARAPNPPPPRILQNLRALSQEGSAKPFAW